MRQRAEDLWCWLEDGAHLYVCGDAKRMATDVDRALQQVVSEQGGLSPDDARAYVARMTKSGLYQRDVY
jgi:sulfite reductase (NADPH) flavoprotein alpha-component